MNYKRRRRVIRIRPRAEENRRLRREMGKRIKSIRLRQGWSQEELAFAIGRTRQTISDIESGKSDTCLSNLFNISEALVTSLSSLLSSEQEEVKS